MSKRFTYRFSVSNIRAKALQLGFLVCGLLFGNNVFGQYEMRLFDTIGKNSFFYGNILRDASCLNYDYTSSTIKVKKIKFLVRNPGIGNRSWLDQDGRVAWQYPQASSPIENTTVACEWGINHSESKTGTNWDTIVFELTYDATQPESRNAIFSGPFKGTMYQNADSTGITATAEATFPLRPSITAVDSIYISVPLCEGLITFNVDTQIQKIDTISAFSEFYETMYYYWELLDGSGNPLSPAVSSLTDGTQREWTIPAAVFQKDWNTDNFPMVSVRRAFCNPGSWQSDILQPQKKRTFQPYELVSDPPLPASQNVLHRMIWWDYTPGFSLQQREEQGRWIPVDDNTICVNYLGQGTYGRLRTLQSLAAAIPAGFTTSTLKPEHQQLSNGYVFLQVGTEPDTTLEYEWVYDPELVERLYVDGDVDFGQNSVRNRFEEYGDMDTNLMYSGFGCVEYNDTNTYRAIFRIKALSPEKREELAQRSQGSDIKIQVTAKCLRCKHPDLTVFQNDPLIINLGQPLDTTKPMNDFYITKTATAGTTPDDNPVCIGQEAYFLTKSDKPTWNLTDLREMYNITTFSGGVRFAGQATFTDTTFFTTSPTLQVFSKVVGQPENQTDQTYSYVKYVQGANGCFMRNAPAINTNTLTFTNLADTAWFRLDTFEIKKRAKAPLIYDEYGDQRYGCEINQETGQLYCRDSLFVCVSPLTDSTGNTRPDQEEEHGITYILANDSDSLTNSKHVVYHDNLGPSPYHGFVTNAQEDPINGRPFGIRAYSTPIHIPGEAVHRSTVRIFPEAGLSGYAPVGLLMFAAEDQCGRGDSVIIPYRLSDTMATKDYLANVLYSMDTSIFPDDWVAMPQDFCENVDAYFRIRDEGNCELEQIYWTAPASWIAHPPVRVSEDYIQLRFTVGADSGNVSLHLVNQCGGNVGAQSPKIVPTGYYRADWVDFHDTICEDSVYTYSLKEMREEVSGELMSDVIFRFPNDWQIVDRMVRPPSNNDPIDTISVTDMTFGYDYDSVWVRTLVGEQSGNILVRWLNEQCDVIAKRPEWWDTIPVFTRLYPSEPQKMWTDTVCARSTVWLSVKSADVDSLQDNYYVWTFPQGWDSISSNAKGDSIQVKVADKQINPQGDTISVQALSRCCHEQKGGILKHAVWIWDTVMIDETLVIIDDKRGAQVGTKPCEGDTLALTLNKIPYLVDSLRWKWGNKPENLTDIVDDSLAQGWWFVENIENYLPDTLAFYPEAKNAPDIDSLYITYNLYNRCGTSRSSALLLEVSEEISAEYTPDFLQFTDTICLGAKAFFVLDSLNDTIRNADRFVWYFNDNVIDTVYGVYSFAWTAEETGKISVRAINNCSSSDLTDSVIKQVKRRTLAPIPNFTQYVQTAGDDTLYFLDTVCAQSLSEWKIQKQDADNDLNYKYFQWLKLAGDTAQSDLFDLFTVVEANDSLNLLPAQNYLRKRTLLGVTAVQEGCEIGGDTLKIWLTSIDTVPLSALDKITIETEANDSGQYCAGSVITLSVPDSAFAYHWILPEELGYSFADADTNKHTVNIKVGQYATHRIGVLSSVGADYCQILENRDTLWFTDTITPEPMPVLTAFTQFTDTLCEGAIYTFRVSYDETAGSKPSAFRWTFPSGWTANADTTTFTDSITIVAGANSGEITVAGLDSCKTCETCENLTNLGKTIFDTVVVLKTPEIQLIIDNGEINTLCPDQEGYVYHFESSDALFTYRFRSGYIEEFEVDQDITIKEGEKITMTGWLRKGGFMNIFTNIHRRHCPDFQFDNDTIKIIPLTLPRDITLWQNNEQKSRGAVDTVCASEIAFDYIAKNADSSVNQFNWTVPQGWDAEFLGEKHDTLRITVDSLLLNGSNLGKIQVNSHCEKDVSDSVSVMLMLDTLALDIYDLMNNGVEFSTRPCGGDTLLLAVNNFAQYDSVKWTWIDGKDTINPDSDTVPFGNNWRFYKTDSQSDTLGLIAPYSSLDTLNIQITVWSTLCQTGKTYSYALVPVSAIESRLMFLQPVDSLTICDGDTINFELNQVEFVDRYIWNYSWTTQSDTVKDVHIRKIPAGDLLNEPNASIWVTPANTCGEREIHNSDTLVIREVLRSPNIVVPLNFAEGQILDTVRDTFCLRTDNQLIIKKNQEDSAFGVSYKWFFIEGDDIADATNYDTPSDTLNIANDSTFVGNKRTVLGVVAIRENCDKWGDTLRIELLFMDTVSLDNVDFDIDEYLDTELCPGTDITLKVNNIAPAYQWILPDTTWKIVGNCSGNEITVTVGEKSGQIGILTLTDSAQQYCQYVDRLPKWSDTLHVRKRPVISGVLFMSEDVPLADDTICAGTEVTIAYSSTVMADSSIFTLHYPDAPSEDTTVVTTDLGYTFTQPVTYKPTMVSVKIMDNFCPTPLFSEPIIDSLVTLSPPKIYLIGDTLPCRDSSVNYTIQKSDSYVNIDDFSYVASDGVTVDTDSTSYINVNFLGDSVIFSFYLSHQRCEDYFTLIAPPQPFMITLKSDTAPAIPIDVFAYDMVVFEPANGACAEDSIMLVARPKDLSIKNIEYNWELPTGWGKLRSSEKGDTLIAFASISAAMDTAMINVYTRGSCGMSQKPHEYRILSKYMPEFQTNIAADVLEPCEDSVLRIWRNGGTDSKNVRWYYPEAPAEFGNDTVYLSVAQDSFAVYARHYNAIVHPDFCRFSKFSNVLNIVPHHQPAAPKPAQNLYPCAENSFGLCLTPDVWTDSVAWDTISGTGTPAFTVFSQHTVGDSLFFANVGSIPFKIIVTAYNSCGYKTDTLTVNPSGTVEPFRSGAMDIFDELRYCANNVVEGFVRVPSQHFFTQPDYTWQFPTDWEIVKEDTIIATGTDTLSMVWFIPRGTNSGIVGVTAQTYGCGDALLETSNEYEAVHLYISTLQTTDSTTYGNSEVMFEVDSVGVEGQTRNVGAFDYVWTPRNRLADALEMVSESEDTLNTYMVRLRYAYLENEIFVVQATENTEIQGCTITDTVYLHVEGTYQYTVDYWDSVCGEFLYTMKINHLGGDPATYSQQWFKSADGVSYTLLSVDSLAIDGLEDENLLYYRVVGTDTLVFYSDTTVTPPLEDERVIVSDTFRFTVKAATPIVARIDSLDLVKVVGDQVQFIAALNKTGDSVKLGDRVRMFGAVEGRAEDFPCLYEWVEDMEAECDFAGYNRTDSSVVISGSILCPQTFVLWVYDTLAFGCESFAEVFVGTRFSEDGKDDFGMIPGGFTPNVSPGINDYFMPDMDEMIILNRWGLEVYKATGEKAHKGWDGRDTKTNRIVDRGDYFYIITIYENKDPNKKHTKTGVVSVF